MFQFITDNSSAIAAFLSAVATFLAAYATFSGPRSAAHLAERLRKESEASVERRRMKMWIFTTLMQERASIAAPEAVKALNLIDVVFKDSPSVRDAWADLFSTFDTNRDVPGHVREERLRGLLKVMAGDLGLADGLRPDDFGRVYYPNAQAEEDRWRALERQAALARLLPKSASDNIRSDDKSTLGVSLFPPKPGEESATKRQA